MILKISERLMLERMLPTMGNLSDQIIRKDIIEKTELTADTIKKTNFRIEKDIDNNNIWKCDEDDIIEIKFSGAEIAYLKDAVTKLDNEKRVIPEMVTLCIAIKELGKEVKKADPEGEKNAEVDK